MIEFKKLSVPKKEFKHAVWNVRANWIVEAALTNIACFAENTDKLDQVRAVEAALFMIGNDVSKL